MLQRDRSRIGVDVTLRHREFGTIPIV